MKVQKYSLPSPRQGGKKIAGDPAEAARELARLLREEAKVL
jgi:electron transfer flavoprotein beta subunit